MSSHINKIIFHIIDRVIGVCGAPVTTHNSGFLGLYGVEKGFQNRGIGKILFNSCMKHIGDRNCGLHAIPERMKMYQDKAGFSVKEGVAMVVFDAVPQNWQNLQKTIDNTIIESIDSKNEELITKIIEYDSKVHLESRQKLLKLTLNKVDYKTFVAIDSKTGSPVGYGCIRLHNGGKGMIGPVYADNDTIAEVLIYNLINNCIPAQNESLLFMTTSKSLGGLRIAQKLQMSEEVRPERLFTKHPIPVEYKYIYCLHSPNFSL